MTLPETVDMNQNRNTAWSGKVLIPMWTIQIGATLLNIAAYIIYLVNYGGYSYYYADGTIHYL